MNNSASPLPSPAPAGGQTRRDHLRMLTAGLSGLATLGAWGTARAAASPGGLLLCTNKGDRSLSIIDPATHQQIALVAEDGITGHELATSLDGKRVFVPIFGNSGVGKPGTDGTLIRVIDLEKRAITGTIDFGKGVRPHCPVMCAANGELYVTTELEQSIAVIDPETLQIKGTISTGQEQSHMLAVTRDGKKGYTANVGPGTVSVMDMKARKLLKVLPITKLTQRISISVDDKYAFTSDQFNGRLAVIDTATDEIKQWVTMPDIGYGTAPTPDGKTLVVALINLNEVVEIDLATMTTKRTVKVPKAPQEVLVRPDGAVAYVSCDASKQIAVIDLKEWKVQTLIDVGTGADGLAWAKQGLNGKLRFFMKSWAEQRILVTGGAGFIGSALVWELNRRGAEQIVVSDLLGTTEKWRNLPPLRFADYVEGDDLRPRLESGALGKFDTVLHLGACSATTERDAAYLIRNNFELTKDLAEWSLKHGARFVYASSAATYGDGSQGMSDADERLPALERLRPLNMYGYSKHLFDLYAQRRGWMPRIVGLKYFNVFGPNEDHKEDMRSVVHKSYAQVLESGVIRLFKSYRPDYADGEQQRDFLYVKDAIAMTLHLAHTQAAGGLYNLGSGEAHSWNELVRAIFAAMGREPKIEYVEMPETLRDKYQYFTQAEIGKLRSTGYEAAITSLEESVRDYVQGYLATGRRLGDEPPAEEGQNK